MFDNAEDWAIALSVATLLNGPEPTTMKFLISNVENDITTIIPVMLIFIRTIGILPADKPHINIINIAGEQRKSKTWHF